MFECCCFFLLKKSILIWTVLVILTFVFFFQGRLEYLVKWKGWAMKWVPWIHNVNVTQALVRFSWKMHINCALEQNECMCFSSCCCICVQAQHLGAGGEHPGWQADFGVWAKVSVAASWGALRVLWVISLDFYLCIYFFSLACFYILAPILKSLKHVCSVPRPPFTFLSCVLVLNYFQCLFL